MGFGTRELPMRLRVARTVVYCQAGVVMLTAAFLLEAEIISGPATGVPLNGLFYSATVSGGGVATIGFADVVVALMMVIADQYAGTRGGSARYALDAAEFALAFYMIGFVANVPGAWIFGPAAGIAALVLHHWPELHAYFFAAGANQAASAAADPPAMTSAPGSDRTVAPPL